MRVCTMLSLQELAIRGLALTVAPRSSETSGLPFYILGNKSQMHSTAGEQSWWEIPHCCVKGLSITVRLSSFQ